MKKILNDTKIVIIIGLIGLLFGTLFQWLILFNHLTEANQKLDILLDEKNYTVCRVVNINSKYYFVCDKTVEDTSNI